MQNGRAEERHEITARVEEVKREPRPTLEAAVYFSDSCRWIVTNGMYDSKSVRAIVTIPGELELARAAAIEKATAKVVSLARDVQGTYAPIRMALEALDRLTAASQEPRT